MLKNLGVHCINQERDRYIGRLKMRQNGEYNHILYIMQFDTKKKPKIDKEELEKLLYIV